MRRSDVAYVTSGYRSGSDVCRQRAFSVMELPETFRKPLEYISRNVLFDQTRPFIPENDTLMPHGKEIQHAVNGQISVSSEGGGRDELLK